MQCAGPDTDPNVLDSSPPADHELEGLLDDALGLLEGLEPVQVVSATHDEDPTDPPTNPTRANLMFVGTIRSGSGSARGRYRRVQSSSDALHGPDLDEDAYVTPVDPARRQVVHTPPPVRPSPSAVHSAGPNAPDDPADPADLPPTPDGTNEPDADVVMASLSPAAEEPVIRASGDAVKGETLGTMRGVGVGDRTGAPPPRRAPPRRRITAIDIVVGAVVLLCSY